MNRVNVLSLLVALSLLVEVIGNVCLSMWLCGFGFIAFVIFGIMLLIVKMFPTENKPVSTIQETPLPVCGGCGEEWDDTMEIVVSAAGKEHWECQDCIVKRLGQKEKV